MKKNDRSSTGHSGCYNSMFANSSSNYSQVTACCCISHSRCTTTATVLLSSMIVVLCVHPPPLLPSPQVVMILPGKYCATVTHHRAFGTWVALKKTYFASTTSMMQHPRLDARRQRHITTTSSNISHCPLQRQLGLGPLVCPAAW